MLCEPEPARAAAYIRNLIFRAWVWVKLYVFRVYRGTDGGDRARFRFFPRLTLANMRKKAHRLRVPSEPHARSMAKVVPIIEATRDRAVTFADRIESVFQSRYKSISLKLIKRKAIMIV